MTAPHVVMLVSNDASTDSRVRKSALAAAATGARVTLVAYASDGDRTDSLMGPVRITRVPVEFTLRDAAKAKGARRRAAGLPLLRPVSTTHDAVLRRSLAARERDEVGGHGGRGLTVRHQAVRGRRFLGRLGAKGSRLMWGGLDRARSKVTLNARWRAVLPEVDDYELAFGPVVDALDPDVIYAHDVQLLPVASRAVKRAALRGKKIPWVYDAHEWVPGLSQYGSRTARVVAAWADLEAEYINEADEVVTVSDDLAAALAARHGLQRLPTVVHNVPAVGERAGTTDVRSELGLPTDVPLLVYSGGVTAARGVATAVSALRELPDAHLAVVAVPSSTAPAAEALLNHARELGVADRFHLLDPVAPHQVIDFVASADVGLIPLRHFGSHEFALANKLFEYLHAGLPMVVSDCRAQQRFVDSNEFGAVHRADDPTALAEAVRSVLTDRCAIRSRMLSSPVRDELTWSAQARIIQNLLVRILPGALDLPAPVPTAGLEHGPERVWQRSEERRTVVGFGPSNSAGQAWAWAAALRAQRPQIDTEVVAIQNGRYDYPCDVAVSKADFARDATWGLNLREHARETWTHALIEAGRPIFGAVGGTDSRADLEYLRRSGVDVGLVFHGSEIRDPRHHAKTHEFSPFRDPRDPYTQRLQGVADRNLQLAAEFDGPIFVSTPDQLDYLPQATWLPVVIDLAKWPLRETRAGGVPLVVHAPSNPTLKGTKQIERALQPFIDSGRIRYQRITDMPPSEAAQVIAMADVVVDQVLLGLYGVLACEALASGAVVLGHVGQSLRDRVPEPVPVIEATPADLRDRMEQVLDGLSELQAEAGARREFVERIHGGALSARVLGSFVDLNDPKDLPRSDP